jgi:hypothetical protein
MAASENVESSIASKIFMRATFSGRCPCQDNDMLACVPDMRTAKKIRDWIGS